MGGVGTEGETGRDKVVGAAMAMMAAKGRPPSDDDAGVGRA